MIIRSPERRFPPGSPRSPFVLALTASVAIFASARPAAADVTKSQCVDANTSAQNSRREGKLSQARDQLRLCGDPHCPRIVRDDCIQRLDELDVAQPTVVFDVKDAAGGDIGDVEVIVDGRIVTQKLDGTALAIDPGEHTLGFVVDDQPPLKQVIVVKEGEKSRRVVVTLGAPHGPLPPPPPPSPPPQLAPPPPHGLSSTKIAGLTMGGVGVASLLLGTVFGVVASSKWSDAKSACASPSSCRSYSDAVSDHDASVTDGAVSTVGFIAGGALVAAGAVVFFFVNPERPSSARLELLPHLAPGNASLTLGGAF